MFYEVLIVVYLIVALMLIGFVLIQQGKGADMGASFGAGSSNTLFGASGSGNFLTKTTTGLATGFFVLSILLGNLTANQVKQTDEWSDLADPAAAVTEIIPQAEDVPSSDKVIPVTDVPADVPVSSEDKSGDVPAGDK